MEIQHIGSTFYNPFENTTDKALNMSKTQKEQANLFVLISEICDSFEIVEKLFWK